MTIWEFYKNSDAVIMYVLDIIEGPVRYDTLDHSKDQEWDTLLVKNVLTVGGIVYVEYWA